MVSNSQSDVIIKTFSPYSSCHDPTKSLSAPDTLFTLMFIVLILLGAYLLSIHSKQFAVATFLFAFAAVFAQIGSLALYIRHKARAQMARMQQTETY